MRTGFLTVLCAVVLSLLPPCATSVGGETQTTLDDAVNACVESAALIEELSAQPQATEGPLAKLLARAKAEATTGKIMLIKDNYAEAKAAFGRSAALCREILKDTKRTTIHSAKKTIVSGPYAVSGTMIYPAPGRQLPQPWAPPRSSASEKGTRILIEAQKAQAAGDMDLVSRLCAEAAAWFAAVGKEQPRPRYVPVQTMNSEIDRFTDADHLARLLESNIGLGDRFAAEEILERIEKLVPGDPRLIWMRRAVESMPGPKSQLTLDLGDGIELELVLIRPGSYIMGGEARDIFASRPHQVTISKPFYIGKYEVTQRQWEKLMGDNPSRSQGPRNPVESVSWNESQTFVKKLTEKFASTGMTFGLPTSPQWEYACRAGAATRFHFGDNESELHKYAWFGLNSDGRTHPVGEKKPNAWGLYDMHGNVWEMCSDRFDNPDYPAGAPLSPEFGPQGPPPGVFHVMRGGSLSASIARCQSASRYPCNPSMRPPNCGLRVICTP